MNPEKKKRFRDRANRARRALLKEKKQFGCFDDGAGRRYGIPVDYFLAGDNKKALEFYSWFESEFPDDTGEPNFDLFWALAEYRAGHEEQAQYRLLVAMLSNLYMLPYLLREPIELLDIWHSSNMEHPDYLRAVEEFLDEPNEEERQWMKKEYDSQSFITLRSEYIRVFHDLDHEKNIQKRRAILKQWRQFSSQFFEKYS